MSTHCGQLDIPADLDRLHDTREWADDIASGLGLSEDDCFQVKLAMSEAVTNAILHGSSDEAARVRIDACRDEEALVFVVQDSGRPKDAAPVERIADGGRGLELVAMVMDDVQLEQGDEGASLRFSKRFAAA